MTKLCAECGERAVASRAAPGRTSPWRQFAALSIPADVAIPTCANCGAEWIDKRTAEAIDAALAKASAQRLTDLARQAIDVLTQSRTQRVLERLLALSDGYLSKVKVGREVPSAQLVGELALLAVRPQRLEEIKHIWATGRLPPLITQNHITHVEVPVDDASLAVAG